MSVDKINLKNYIKHVQFGFLSMYTKDSTMINIRMLIHFYRTTPNANNEQYDSIMEKLKEYKTSKQPVNKKIFIDFLNELSDNVDKETNDLYIIHKQLKDEKIKIYNQNKKRTTYDDFTIKYHGFHPFVNNKIMDSISKPYSILFDHRQGKISFYSINALDIKARIEKIILDNGLDWNIKNVFEFIYDIDSNPVKDIRLE